MDDFRMKFDFDKCEKATDIKEKIVEKSNVNLDQQTVRKDLEPAVRSRYLGVFLDDEIRRAGIRERIRRR